MELSKQILEKAAQDGSKKAANAFSQMSGQSVDIVISDVEELNIAEVLEKITPSTEKSIVVNAQLLSGVTGTSILILVREHALMLADILNKQEVGTTGILKDIDRSALKETLNILSNSYITALSESANIELNIGVPNMIASGRLFDIVSNTLKKDNKDDKVVFFKTKLAISDFVLEASLFIVFNETLVGLIEDSM